MRLMCCHLHQFVTHIVYIHSLFAAHRNPALSHTLSTTMTTFSLYSISCHHSTASSLQATHLHSLLNHAGQQEEPNIFHFSFTIHRFANTHLNQSTHQFRFLWHPTSQLPLCLLELTSTQLIFHLHNIATFILFFPILNSCLPLPWFYRLSIII